MNHKEKVKTLLIVLLQRSLHIYLGSGVINPIRVSAASSQSAEVESTWSDCLRRNLRQVYSRRREDLTAAVSVGLAGDIGRHRSFSCCSSNRDRTLHNFLVCRSQSQLRRDKEQFIRSLEEELKDQFLVKVNRPAYNALKTFSVPHRRLQSAQ